MQTRRTVLLTLHRPPPPLTSPRRRAPSRTPGGEGGGGASLWSPLPRPPGRVASQSRPRTWQLLSWGRFFTRIFLRLLSSRRIRCSRAATSSGCSAEGAGPRASSQVPAEGPGPHGPGPAAPPRPAPPSPAPPPAVAIFPAPRGGGLLGRLEAKRTEEAGGGPRGGEAGGGRRVGPGGEGAGRRSRGRQPAGGEGNLSAEEEPRATSRNRPLGPRPRARVRPPLSPTGPGAATGTPVRAQAGCEPPFPEGPP